MVSGERRGVSLGVTARPPFRHGNKYTNVGQRYGLVDARGTCSSGLNSNERKEGIVGRKSMKFHILGQKKKKKKREISGEDLLTGLCSYWGEKKIIRRNCWSRAGWEKRHNYSMVLENFKSYKTRKTKNSARRVSPKWVVCRGKTTAR